MINETQLGESRENLNEWENTVQELKTQMGDIKLKKILKNKMAGIPIDADYEKRPTRETPLYSPELFLTGDGLVKGTLNWKNNLNPELPSSKVVFGLNKGKIICTQSDDWLIPVGKELEQNDIDILGELTPLKIRERLETGKTKLSDL